MPLAVGTLTAPSTGTGTPVVPADIPSARWIDPLGTEWPLTDQSAGWFTMTGVKGLGAAPITITADDHPRGGVRVRPGGVHPGARLITWPLFVEGRTHGQFIDRWRALARAFTMTRRRGPGTLIITRPDGSERQIKAYYQDGYDGDPEAGVRWDMCALTLLCEDPYWRSMDPTLITRAYALPGGSFLSPFPNVTASGNLGAATATNPGPIEVWPDWTITGPASSITVADEYAQSWTLDPVAYRGSALIAGETVVVHTEPPSVVGPDGSSWAGALNFPGAVLFGLDEGDTNLTFTIAGAGAGTSISASYYGRHETA
jgi:hypothetical protein